MLIARHGLNNLEKRIRLVKENDDSGSEHFLKSMLGTYEEIGHELYHYLKDESLERTIQKSRTNIEKKGNSNNFFFFLS